MTQSIQTILADWIEIQIGAHSGVPLLCVSGAQGIGKSTAMHHVKDRFDNRVAILGLDDFYLTRAERAALADQIHPLFAVRGPPGTHDIRFLEETIAALRHATPDSETALPVFDKRIDDRSPRDAWSVFRGRPRGIILEGWCVGALADDMAAMSEPLNSVEANDASGAWRAYQETQLAGPYSALWDSAQAFFHLCAPSFDQVLEWRLQQEATTHGVSEKELPLDKRAWVEDFIQHYERLTRRMLSGQRRSGYMVRVDAARRPHPRLETPLIVASDLDGTLLDHRTYAFEAALPALEQLKAIGSVLVLASSKTAAEMAPLRSQLGFAHCPAIVENGAGRLEPGQTVGALSDADYQAIRRALTAAPQELRQHFEGFGDVSAEHISEITGLSLTAARLAKQRCFSEPGLWTGSADALERFLDHLQGQGIIARQGGRFLTLSFGATKADRLSEIVSAYAPAPIIALGDAPNDVEMLEAAHYAVIVKNTGGAGVGAMRNEVTRNILRTGEEGPTGWNQAVLDILRQLGLAAVEK